MFLVMYNGDSSIDRSKLQFESCPLGVIWYISWNSCSNPWIWRDVWSLGCPRSRFEFRDTQLWPTGILRWVSLIVLSVVYFSCFLGQITEIYIWDLGLKRTLFSFCFCCEVKYTNLARYWIGLVLFCLICKTQLHSSFPFLFWKCSVWSCGKVPSVLFKCCDKRLDMHHLLLQFIRWCFIWFHWLRCHMISLRDLIVPSQLFLAFMLFVGDGS